MSISLFQLAIFILFVWVAMVVAYFALRVVLALCILVGVLVTAAASIIQEELR